MTRPSRWALALRVLSICCALPLGLAHAAAPARVVLITSDRESPTARRFIKELNTLDVEVVTVTGDASAPSIRKELERVAAEQHAFAAVRIVPTGNEAEVWVADRVTGKTLVREVISGTNAGQFDEAVSLGAVELLRASLLEVATETELKGDVAPRSAGKKLLPPKPVADPTKNREKAPAAPREARPFAAIGVGPAIDLGHGQLGASGALELDLKIASGAGWGSELLYRSTFGAQEIHRSEGDVFLNARQLALLGCFAPTIGPWLPALGLGFAAASVITEGQTDSPTVLARKEQRLRWLALARLGIGYQILPSVGVRLDGTAGYSTTPLMIRVANHDTAEYGRPFGSVALGIDLRMPLGAD